MRHVRVFLAGQAVSLIGTWMQATGQGWLAWQLTHSTQVLGTVAMFQFLPFLVLSGFAGSWADRLNRRLLLLWLQAAGMTIAVVLAALVQAHAIEPWHLYMSATCLGIVATLEMAARPVFLGDLAGPDQRRAISLNSSMTQASRLVGPALAGLVIAMLGVAATFWLNAASFVAVIGSLLLIADGTAQQAGRGTRTGTFREALGFLGRTAGLRELVLLSGLLTFFGMSAGNILPAVADEVLNGHAATLGWLLSASGGGALVGGLVVVPLVHDVLRVGVLAAVATVWAGAWLIVLSLSTWLPLSLAALALSGLAFPVVITTTVGMLQYAGPRAMRARLQGALLMVTFGVQPFAAMAIGCSAGFLGPAPALRVNGLFLVLGPVLLLAASRSVRDWQPTSTPMIGVST